MPRRTIKLKIAGRGVDTDAPTVDDLLDQVRDQFEILKGVEEAVAEDGTAEIEWRIIDASKNTPLALEAAPFARQFAMNVDRRAEIVIRATATGLHSLQTRGERPAYFSEKVLARAEKLFERVVNGLSQTEIDFGSDLPSVTLTRSSAHVAATNVRRILQPPAKQYKELGSIEGIAHSLYTDGWGNRIVRVRHRLTGDYVACRLSGRALEQIEARTVGEVWKNCRLQLYGIIYFKALGRINRVDAREVRFLRKRHELPSVDEILDEAFTGGLTSEEYLERLRDGGLS